MKTAPRGLGQGVEKAHPFRDFGVLVACPNDNGGEARHVSLLPSQGDSYGCNWATPVIRECAKPHTPFQGVGHKLGSKCALSHSTRGEKNGQRKDRTALHSRPHAPRVAG